MPRSIYTSASGVFTGAQFVDSIAGHLNTFYDALAVPISSIAGSNNLTGTVNADFVGNGLQEGQMVSWTQPVTNTGAVDLSLNGFSAVPLVDSFGDALISGALPAGLRVLAQYQAFRWRILSVISAGAAAGQPRYHDRFTSNGTWTKPSGLSDGTLATVILVAAGGGGYSTAGGGGGGGGAAIGFFRLGDLPSSAAVTVPSGGAIDSAGGNTTFGTLLTAYGGSAGQASGVGGVAGSSFGGLMTAGGGGSSGAADGGDGYFGGGGGANYTGGGAGGNSVMSGNGGAATVPGTAPGGGGGAGAAGARGQADIYI